MIGVQLKINSTGKPVNDREEGLGKVPLGTPTILLVEDEYLIRANLADYLREAEKFKVLEAANGDEALGILNLRHDIDVVITDIAMPGMTDGVALAAWLRINRPDIKIVLVSGHLRGSAHLGLADLVFTKPIRETDLLVALIPLLEKVARRRLAKQDKPN